MSKIYGIALTAEGQPVAGVDVDLMAPTGDVAERRRTGGDGIFEFEVEAGTWGLKWTHAGGESNEGSVEVSEGEDAEVELEVG